MLFSLFIFLLYNYRGCPEYSAKTIHHETIIFGEVGLTGEVRSVNLVEKRINEASKMGFKKCIIPKGNLEGLEYSGEVRVVGVDSVEDALVELFQ